MVSDSIIPCDQIPPPQLAPGWFGETWNAPACTPDAQQPTPVGATCLHCQEGVAEDDQGFINQQGFVWHLDCFLRGLFGGVNHQRGQCTCCGGDQPPDPPDLSLREAARQAVAEWID